MKRLFCKLFQNANVPVISLADLGFLLVCFGFIAYLFSKAWVTEDAYITFRVIDNFINGYGLRWNIDERVQVYTHPLWMLINIPPYWLTGNIFISSSIMSAIIGYSSVFWIIRQCPARYIPILIFVLLPFIASESINNFVVCGLETPLSMFLLGWFFYEVYKLERRFYKICLIASLAILTRFDNVIFVAPCLLWLTLCEWRQVNVLRLIKAFMPLLAWCLFCLFYYGFVMPNTKYAKLNTSIEFWDYFKQGINYYTMSWHFDKLGLVLISAAIFLNFCCLLKSSTSLFRNQLPEQIVSMLLGCSLAAYCLYILCIGGDFMQGRFFAVPAYLSIFYLYRKSGWLLQKSRMWAYLAIFIVLAANALIPKPVFTEDIPLGIADERKFYLETNSVIYTIKTPSHYVVHIATSATHSACSDGIGIRENADQINTVFSTAIGMRGYCAGPNITIIDGLALSDALLARLPVINPKSWRIGHFERLLPQGYMHARETGDLSQMPETIRLYYEKLRLVTSGDLFDVERLKTIIGFQLNHYDYLLDEFLSPKPAQ
jgi:arabinofuranosyltransferase